MGEGDVVGDVILGLALDAGVAETCGCDALFVAADNPLSLREPKLMFGRALGVMGPPLGRWPLAPAALMVTDGFFAESPFTELLLFTIVGPFARACLLFDSC